MRTTFMVGKVTRRGSEMVVVESAPAETPIPGPWTLKALVRPAPARSRPCPHGSLRVH